MVAPSFMRNYNVDRQGVLGLYSVMGDVVQTTDVQQLTDEELLLHAQNKPSAFEFLVVRYQKLFFARARAVMGDVDAAEDVVQDAFVRIYRFAPRFQESQGTFKAWAMTVLMNTARTHYQKRAKEWGRTVTLETDHYEALPDTDKREGIEAKDIIERALVCVPDDVAEVLQLAFLDGLPYRDIGEKLGLSEGAVKTRVHRAKKILKQTIGSIDI